MSRRHLTDPQIVDTAMGGPVATDHLRECPSCRSRLHDVQALLDETARAATADETAAFPQERLTRQRERIMARLDAAHLGGRVISFPNAYDAQPPVTGRHPSRWVAAAAAAGLVVGLLGGRLTHDPRARTTVQGSEHAAALSVAPPSRPADDELWWAVEDAPYSAPSALRPLDALTPVAWDVPISGR